MLVINQLTYQYQQAWFSFDLQVERGCIIALMGPSGAGKSTLLSLLAGFIAPQSGDIWVDGQSILAKAPYQRPFSMLFQEHNLFSHLSVRENIALGLHPGLKLNAQQKNQVQWAAQQVGIESFLDRLPEQLSGGQRQRVALARCFVQSHPIWLLDEPFSALDPLLREEMLQLVKSLAQARKITVLMVTHHLNDAKTIASHFAFMDQGKVEVVGEVSALPEPQNHPAFAEFIRAGS
ncbi:thiamine ABC transporter ATP-binding protein [Vibrio cincinnatiensis]|jgi:thiamine transport system ATP-binding protein|uniref:Thiamine transport system ATP-binding protein n=1 Tax=Vibrio cincinnatiensis DSM 19608 TaxID=1123491 RepID=A0A1T4QU44_VIBCI|nr:thiamine ABC transporter ATP-binding protein [Vibrio cincinnatiensis]SKA07260.1 thiamine transport system ATP-binding protein [Vibrio cincinnatiensis DSM 19608]SUP47598.1 thiamine ABC transporter ATP-binding protein [Vibrio cincinnatiensis]